MRLQQKPTPRLKLSTTAKYAIAISIGAIIIGSAFFIYTNFGTSTSSTGADIADGSNMTTSLSGDTIYTLKSGNWEDPATWDHSGNLPFGGDVIILNAFDTVTITSIIDLDNGNEVLITINGALQFDGGGSKLYMACGSGVTINIGGSILSIGNGSGSSQNIKICGDTYWEARDGDVSGPLGWGASALPIELVGFDADYTKNEVELTWTTASETNNDYFTIERSSDGLVFETIGEVKGAGTSSRTLSYQFIDNGPLPITSYYRLKQTDFNGMYSYSQVVLVQPKGENGGAEIMAIGPNPFTNTFKIDYYIESAIDIEIEIVNTSGQSVHRKALTPEPGNNSYRFNDGENLSPGLYFLNVTSNGKTTETHKLMKR